MKSSLTSAKPSAKPSAISGGSGNPCSSGIVSSLRTQASPANSTSTATSHAGCTLSVFNGTAWSKPTNPFADDGRFGDYVSSTSPSCSATATCVARSGSGYLSVFGGSTWSQAIDPFATDGALSYGSDYTQGLLCPTAGSCLAYSAGGWASALGGTTWATPTNPFASDGVAGDFIEAPDLGNPQCLSPTFCYAASTAGFFSSFNGTSWTTPRALPGSAQSNPFQVVCASVTVCAVEFFDGSLTFLVGNQWSANTPSPFPPSDTLEGYLTCLGSSFCYEVGIDGGLALFNSGQEISESDPFTSPPLPAPSYIGTASCLSSTFCVADSHGVTSQDIGYISYLEGTSWTTPTMANGGSSTCVSTTIRYTGYELDTYSGTQRTSSGNAFATDGDGSDSSISINCLSSTSCDATSREGFVSFFDGTSFVVRAVNTRGASAASQRATVAP